ncbi:MAG: N-acetyltransferase [Proteobacteria bacterium]|nr:N-acetyltransferase [Pseudomonadota bacterium]
MRDTGKRFEIDISGHTVFATYRLEGKTLFIDHVEAPPALRGTGAAGALMKDILTRANGDGLTITPICGYAASWLRRNAS